MSEARVDEREASLLAVRELAVVFELREGRLAAVEDVSYTLARGRTLGIVGESGSGKSVLALSLLRLVPPPGRIVRGNIRLDGVELTSLDEREITALRGDRVAMIFQEPMTALNPVFTIGEQIAEALRLHRDMGRGEASEAARAALARVGISAPERRARDYPHQLSGGMRQRAMIAMALACQPALLVADEPTTALDVTIQAQILALILDLQKELGMGLILITHDLGVVAQTAQRVIVMYAGKKVEEAGVEALFARPRHPYTRGLMASIPAVPATGTQQSARLAEIPGTVPSLTRLPAGCAFAPRCAFAVERCRDEYPPLQDFGDHHLAACWRGEDMARLG